MQQPLVLYFMSFMITGSVWPHSQLFGSLVVSLAV